MPSFDIVSEVNLVEVKNALDQSNKEITNRYDFKGSDARVELADKIMTAYADSDFQLDQVKDVLLGKLAKGGGTLFIKRGSGDSVKIREQMTAFLKQDSPVLFFPEATTSDGTRIKKVHGRLLGAAIEAQRPVQICLICYVNQQGELDMVAPFIGETPFAKHVQNVLEMPNVAAHLIALPAIDSAGHTVESLTQEVQRKMTEGLAQLHERVLKPSA